MVGPRLDQRRKGLLQFVEPQGKEAKIVPGEDGGGCKEILDDRQGEEGNGGVRKGDGGERTRFSDQDQLPEYVSRPKDVQDLFDPFFGNGDDLQQALFHDKDAVGRVPLPEDLGIPKESTLEPEGVEPSGFGLGKAGEEFPYGWKRQRHAVHLMRRGRPFRRVPILSRRQGNGNGGEWRNNDAG